MNARTIRRAIERKAQKQARKEAAAATSPASGSSAGLPVSEDQAGPPFRTHISGAQLEANRRNAALSTGPATPEGKSRASRNALKTGLTGRTMLLSSEESAPYELHLQRCFAELRPVGDRETELVQSLADTQWRLARIPSLEMGIYALGRIQFADAFENRDPREAAALIEAQTYLTYQRQLNNLSIQESRLRRQCEKDTAELKQLQQLRQQAERSRKTTVPSASVKAQPQANGFEFSTAGLELLDTHPGPDSTVLRIGKAA